VNLNFTEFDRRSQIDFNNEMSEQGWSKYVEKTKERGPRELLVEAMQFVAGRDAALDLGAGALHDSKYLLQQGFKHVIAVDRENLAQEIADALHSEQLEYKIASFEEFDFRESAFDIVNAEYSLPFNPPQTFGSVFAKLKQSLKPEGVFAGQLFGDRDEWASHNPKMTFCTRAEAEELLRDLEVIKFEEEEKDGKPVIGNIKHWHIFHIIARKK
jgi:tellurite methyltransferase